MPEEDKLEITTLSSNAFYYFGREELKHKLLLIEDLDGAESVLYPLRIAEQAADQQDRNIEGQ